MSVYEVFRGAALKVNSGLGNCPRCMRRSFLAAAAAWIVLIPMAHVIESGIVLIVLRAMAAILTLLWVAHVAMFSVRRTGYSANIINEEMDSSRRSVFAIFTKAFIGTAAWTALPRLASAQVVGNKVACPKDRTTTSNLVIAQKSPSEKGTVGIITVRNLNVQQKKIEVKTEYAPDLTYEEAAKHGSSGDAFFWVPNSIMPYEDIQAGKKPAKGVHIMSCCSSNNGCSRCCPSGGCICTDTDNGGCFCSNC